MANTGQQADEVHDAALPRVVIELGRSARSGEAYRVEAPDRILRIFGLLTEARNELNLNAIPPATRARLQRQLEAVSAEIDRSVSRPLAREFHNLIGVGEAAQGATAPGAAELRIEYASLLGWASGLVVAMLDQLSTPPPAITGPPLPDRDDRTMTGR